MKTVTWRKSRVLKLSLIACTILLTGFLCIRNTSNYYRKLSISSPELKAKQVPWFTEGVLGNFEPEEIPFGDAPGEGGVRYVKDGGDQVEIERVKRIYGINMVASEDISYERAIPDTRMEECKHWNYPQEMRLKASIVIAFFNEGLSTLLRNIHQILKRTPKELLQEIVLVDDFSDLDNLKEDLEKHIERINTIHPNMIRLIRNQEREGLIRTRAIGAEESVGDVVVFLDAHCEVNRNWLPPLLAPIFRDRTIMTVPFIDGINHETFEYQAVYGRNDLFRGIFDWGLLYKEMDVSEEEIRAKAHRSEPYKAPTHAGGLFAIDRKYFLDLGGYDPGLLGWGAENFELSFKIWQCGGSLEWVPCSHIGHIYRGVPYGFGKLNQRVKGPLVKINYNRVVEVWFDDKYKEFFYTREPLNRNLAIGDISKQLAFKEKHQCKSFTWFMENVAKELLEDFPELPKNLFWGELRNKGSNSCLDVMGRRAPSEVGMSGCHGMGSNQLFRLNAEGQLGVGERCVQIEGDKVKQIFCPKGHADGPWLYDLSTGTLRHKGLDKCLAIHPTTKALLIRDCESSNTYHRWIWKETPKKLN